MRYCLALDLKDDPALIEEYEQYHRNVWPEIVQSIREAGIKDSEIIVCVGAGDDDPTDRDIARVFSQQGLSIDVLRLPGDLPRTGTGKVAYPELRQLALDA